MVFNISNETVSFLRDNRVRYRWPLSHGRGKSERAIEVIRKETQTALVEKDPDKLRSILIRIHEWKTGGRITSLYRETLNSEMSLIQKIITYIPPKERFLVDSFNDLLDVLKVKYCNLPVASAQSSFLLNRTTPIIDRFVAQFFSRKVSKRILQIEKWDMKSVFGDLNQIPFKIQDDGTGRCVPRLAVYDESSYQRNKSLFLNFLLPKLDIISKILNRMNVNYQGLEGSLQNFTPVDVEMAIFSFGSQNREHFQCFYDGPSIPTLIV